MPNREPDEPVVTDCGQVEFDQPVVSDQKSLVLIGRPHPQVRPLRQPTALGHLLECSDLALVEIRGIAFPITLFDRRKHFVFRQRGLIESAAELLVLGVEVSHDIGQ